jgi:hypothetical protein
VIAATDLPAPEASPTMTELLPIDEEGPVSMLDVHPSRTAAHRWKDFWIHLVTGARPGDDSASTASKYVTGRASK